MNAGQRVRLVSITEIETRINAVGWYSHHRRLMVGDIGVVTKNSASDGLFEVSFCDEPGNKWSPVVILLCSATMVEALSEPDGGGME